MAVCEKQQQGSVSSSGALSPSPPLPTDQLGGPLVEPSLTTGEAIDKYQLVAQKVESDYPLISLSWSFNVYALFSVAFWTKLTHETY
jgi:hypothetical protein